jgi:amino acid adenylation domain-containing protein
MRSQDLLSLSFPTLVDAARERAASSPEAPAYIFLSNGEEESERLTYADLDRRARAIAAFLQSRGGEGERVLLLHPQGLDFLVAFFGCLYAGALAVPCQPPGSRRSVPRLRAVVRDCRPRFALTSSPLLAKVRGGAEPAGLDPDLALASDALPLDLADAWQAPRLAADSLAFLQYTSGSTSDPKGVMVSHGNLLANSAYIDAEFRHDAESVLLSWLPFFHDMGLIYGVIQPLFKGIPAVLLSPVSFLQKPLRWLEGISRYRVTHSGGPNFAYELCAQRVGPEQRERLDLSSWSVAFNGAEPIDPVAVRRFVDTFSDCGLRWSSVSPAYGLAEATLKVTAVPRGAEPLVERFETASLERRQARLAEGTVGGRPLIGCGRPGFGTRVEIVDPAAGALCLEGQVGEIWVSGPGMAQGYWERPVETEETFRARLASGEGPFLRTGDLGFRWRGELFVTGRIKDLIILHGLNHYPQDLERTMYDGREGVRGGCAAAFSVQAPGGERLVLVQEVERTEEGDWERLIDEIRQAIIEEHEIQPWAIVLVAAGQVPKTTSGKIQRAACRAAFLAGELEEVARWTADRDAGAAGQPAGPADLTARFTALLAAQLGCAPEAVDADRPLFRYGLDSIAAIELQHRIESELGVEIPMVSFLGRSTLAEVVRELAGGARADGSAAPAPRDSGRAGAAADPLPLSPGQRGLWFLQSLAPESAAYNIAIPLRLRVEVEQQVLRRSFQALTDRHPALRTTFPLHAGEPEQKVHALREVDFLAVDASGWSDGELRRELAREAFRPFDLAAGPLLRIRLFRRTGEAVLSLVVHHIVADFWSLSTLFRELRHLWAAQAAGRPSELPFPPVTYADCAAAQVAALAGPELRRLETFWQEAFARPPEPLALPTDRPRPPVQTDRGGACLFIPGAESAAVLRELGRLRGATLFMQLLALFQTLLGRMAGQEEVVVGTPSAGRRHREWAEVVGYFVNPIALRGDLSGSPSFAELLDRTRERVLAAFAHQDYPFPLLVGLLQPERDPSRPPVFQVMLTLQKAPTLDDEALTALALGEEGACFDLGGLPLESVALAERPVAFDLSLVAAERGGELALSLQHNRDLFDSSTAARLARGFTTLARAAAAAPECPLADLPLFAEEERQQVVAEWNDTAVHWPCRSVLELFAAQVARDPSAVAVSCGGSTLTYGALDRRSDRLAALLLARGLPPETRVGIAVERSLEMVVAVFGVLKSGCAYVPLDAAYPAERIAAMLEDSAAPLVLVRGARPPGLESVATLALDPGWEASAGEAAGLRRAVEPGQLAYVLYTSGSTGRPKGVQIGHGALANFLQSMQRDLALRPGDALLAVTTLGFDISGLELYLPLIAGARVVVARREETVDGRRLAALIDAGGITRMQATPATWKLLLEAGWTGRPGLTLLCGGEALPRDLAERLRAGGAALWNVYGPTETTIWSTAWRVEEGAVSIGRPLANTDALLLDRAVRPVPAGVWGELCLGGAGLARGYLGRPALTAERFVPHPCAEEPGARIYRTGDLARWRADGTLDCAGRLDHQIKIRGFRVEAGEIEAVLAEHSDIAEAVVAVHDLGARGSSIVAYHVPLAGRIPSPAELRAWVRRRLPEHMVPAAFVSLASLPLTPSGKVDRRALPPPVEERGGTPGLAATTRMQRVVAGIWREVLGLSEVGITDNFFDLGGHSLMLPRVHARLCEVFGRDLSLVDLFRHPTVAALAELLGNGAPAADAPEEARRRVLARREAGGRPGFDVAVIGAAGRFPGAGSLDELWTLVREGKEGIASFRRDEVEPPPGRSGWADEPGLVRRWGVLAGIDLLDAPFFGYSPAEAASVSPQARIFLECAWEALERAGYDPDRYAGAVGVFSGCAVETYFAPADLGSNSLDSFRFLVGGDKDFLSTRVSYKLGLRGPSVTVQTACSTSLVAVHLACQSLLAGESDMVLAGGVAIRLPQKSGYVYHPGGILSPDGRCRAFDAGGRGTVGGNGAGVVVLKRLEEALADGDHVLAVIKGSAINNDGSRKIGYTAPSVEGQCAAILEAQGVAGIDPSTIGYVETHGTATELGDPIEMTALRQAFGAAAGTGTCAIGSIKTNIGHLDTASGIAGLLKTVLAVERGEIPPSLWFEAPNPKIDFAASPFFVNTGLRPWRAGQGPRRAGVSSFGLGGTNAHVVLEQAPEPAPAGEAREWQLLLLSARTPSALEASTDRLREHLKRHPELSLADAAYTLQTGRRRFRHRRALIVRSGEDALQVLSNGTPARALTGEAGEGGRRVVFLLQGLGDHYPGMAGDLYAAEPVFRDWVDRAASLATPLLGRDFREVFFAAPAGAAGGPDLRSLAGRSGAVPAAGEAGTPLAHTAVFALEYALARLLMEWGVRPQALLGYSLGEYVAACLAEVFSFEDAVAIVAERGRWIDELAAGALLAVPLPENEMLARLGPDLWPAALNGRAATVVAGEPAAVDELQRRLEEEGIACRRVAAERAFHTPWMEPAAQALRCLLERTPLAPPRIPWLSNLTGTWITPEEATSPDYWAAQMCQPVRFADGIGELLRESGAALVEIGLGQALGSFVRQHPDCGGEQAGLLFPTLSPSWDRQADQAALLRTLGRLWLAGVEPDWTGFHRGARRRRAPLPTYPFERQSHWLAPRQPSRREDVADWFHRPVWRPADLAVPAAGAAAAGPWLVVLDPAGLGERLAGALEGRGGEVFRIAPGSGFHSALCELPRLPAEVIHLGCAGEEENTGLEGLAGELERGFHDLLSLARALAERRAGESVRITVVTRALQRVAAGDRVLPARAALLGACRGIPLDCEGLSCHSVDLPCGEDGDPVEILLAELAANAPAGEIAWRQGQRYARAFEAVRLERRVDAALRPEAVWLITGGLGGLGLTVAADLAGPGRRLVLIGRAGLPPREGWEEILATPDTDPELARRLRAVRALEEAGAEVLALGADVTDEASLCAAVAEARARFGAIHGVVHAAGLPGGGLLQHKTRAAAAAVLAPKVIGILLLERVLAEEPVEALILFSSISAVLGGGPGQVDYAAANAFLGAYAESRAGAGPRVLAIDWAEWQWNAWESGLAGFAPPVRERLREHRRRLGIPAEEGADALRRALASGLSRVVVCPRDLSEAIVEASHFAAADLLRTAPAEPERPPAQLAVAAPDGSLEGEVAAVWRRVLGVSEIGRHDNFFELGGNSLLGLQVISDLKRRLGTEIPSVALYEAPTVSALAGRLGALTERPVPAETVRTAMLPARQAAEEGIAIIGMAGRFPGAPDVDALWRNLLEGREAVTFFSDAELLAAGVPREVLRPGYVRAGAVLDEIESFDAGLFGYAPREAEVMDPQHRLFLECAWEALERAGCDSSRYPGAIGVFGGSNISTYLLRLLADPQVAASLDLMQANLLNANDSLTTKVSYKLGLRGPSVAVQTFCSTSSVAVHLACESLLRGECDMALAGGVSLRVPQRVGYRYAPGGIDSPDGHCRAFDAQAAGALLGNGVALVVLKPLSRALADGDHIHAVIRGSAINNDGSLKVGYTAPSVDAQAAVIAQAIARSGVDAGSVRYIEAHGTGTRLGDPIEVAALTRAFRRTTEERGFCALGSVKTNLGHLDRAAGVTGLIKAALAVEHGVLPASLHFETPNPEIDFAGSPFFVNTALRPWPGADGPRRAGVNALGIGGTNVHFILEEPPAAASTPSGPSRSWQLLLLSTEAEGALERATTRLAAFLRESPQTPLADVASTLQTGRRQLSCRRMLVAREAGEAAQALEELEPRRIFTNSVRGGRELRPVFLFPGLGDHYPGLAAEIYREEPVFRASLDRSARLLEMEHGFDLREALFAGGIDRAGRDGKGPDLRRLLRPDTARGALDRTEVAQPALFAVEMALIALLDSWGLRPRALAGYSLGEYAAACTAGVLTLEDALRLVAWRAARISELPAGAMLAVPLAEQELAPLLEQDLSLGAVNGPALCVASGPVAAIERLERELAARQVACRRVQTGHAVHSTMMEPLRRELEERLGRLELRPPRVPYLSNVTGTWIMDEQATSPVYWGRHLCETVRFADGLAELLALEEAAFVEVGPGQTLAAFLRQHPAWGENGQHLTLPTLPAAFDRQPAYPFLLSTLGRLWLAGAAVDWQGFQAGERRRRAQLPTYPFERQRYWIETRPPAEQQPTVAGKQPDVADWFYAAGWRRETLPQVGGTGAASPWLLLGEGGGLRDAVARHLEQQGREVVRIADSDDLEARLVELAAAGKAPRQIVHLGAVTPVPGGLAPAALAAAQESGFYSVLAVVQALGRRMPAQRVDLALVATRLVAVTAGDEIEPAKATLLGIGRVIPQELPNLRCVCIDLEPCGPGGWNECVVESLVAEVAAGAPQPAVALRDSARWVESFDATRLEEPVATLLRPGGVYLITGGLGGVGLTLAEGLVRRCGARLVLTGRSGLPGRELWDEWLTERGDSATAQRIRRLRALEEAGGEVLPWAADASDEAAMRAAIDAARQRFGALHGVIHAAGRVDIDPSHILQRLDRAACESFLAAKVHGLAVLDRVLDGAGCDFCLLFSSVSTVLGGLGFAAYAAANCVLDAFAQAKRGTAGPLWRSVDWDTWKVHAGETADPVRRDLERTVAELSMEPAEGVEAFLRVLDAAAASRVVHSTGDLQARLDQWVYRQSGGEAEAGTAPAPASRYARPDLLSNYVPAGSAMERRIAEVWQRILGIEKVGILDNYFDLGGTSLSAIQVVAELQKELDTQLTPVILFEAPTVSELARRLAPEETAQPNDRLLRAVARRRRARDRAAHGGVAIIGLAGRFPGASDVESFWRNLRGGVESLSFFSDEELRASGVDASRLANPAYVRARPVLDDVEHFDAQFFGYSPREANFLSPQHRLFLETAWQALESAGYDSLRFDGSIGVFGGSNFSTYYLTLLSQPDVLASFSELETAIANDRDSLATTVSYKLNLKGPSFTVQTFCSTSLVAVHLACQSLREGECDMALAGGVSVRVPVKVGHLFQEGGQDSPDGHTRTFDAQASGTVFGDGVGVVVLKRLEDALADGDIIHAVVRGSAMNNDGAVKVGYTAPSIEGQAEVVAAALADAGIEAGSIQYVEAHGTATELGDPIEVAALTRAFRLSSADQGFCALGSVKTNVGHLDRAAGVTGLIKTVLALEHRELPPVLHFTSPNPRIDFAAGPFYVNDRLRPWPAVDGPRRAGVNSLGVGGTNVHAVLEEAPPRQPSGPSRPWQLLLLSAQTPTALEKVTGGLADFLERDPDGELADVAYTLQVGRRVFEHRRFAVCRAGRDAVGARAAGSGRLVTHFQPAGEPRVAFLFPGMGDHYPGMAADLYREEPAFREVLDRCADLLAGPLGIDLRPILFSPSADGNGAEGAGLRRILGRDGRAAGTSPLARTSVGQPAVFAVEYALARWLLDAGVRPQALLGYSLGEYVAACLAGVFSLEDALELVARRALLLESLPAGAMLGVALSPAGLEALLPAGVSLAAVNGPELCVAAGTLEGIVELEEALERQGVAHRRLETTHAFHSTMMEPARAPFREVLRRIALREPSIPFISNVTGTWIAPGQATDPEYWLEHMCRPVRFADGVRELLVEPARVCIEIGPGQSLSSFVKQHPDCRAEQASFVIPALRAAHDHGQPDLAVLLGVLGRLWLAGARIDWKAFSARESRRRTVLPTYPFERRRCWIDGRPLRLESRNPLAGLLPAGTAEALARRADVADWFWVPIWKQSLELVDGGSRPDAVGQSWLLFVDGRSFGEMVARLLRERGEHVVTVAPGDACAQRGERAWTVRPDLRADYDTLLRELKARGETPTRIIHLWSVAPESAEGLDATLRLGFDSLVLLAQALGETDIGHLRLGIVSTGLQGVLADDPLDPAKATLIGPCRVIPVEHAGVACRSLDVLLPEAGTAAEEELADLVVTDLASGSVEPVVAYRRGQRWIQSFDPVRLSGASTEPILREGGVYLLTGGLGGIGLAMAGWMARTARARLVLVGRSGLPPREVWDELLAVPDDPGGVARKIRQVLALEEAGSEILVVAADVADRDQMAAAVAAARARFGTLHGALHLAGVPAEGLMQLKTPEALRRVLAPKIAGLRVLDEVLGGEELDFLVLFSSITSVTGGGPGQVDYCAANAYLDAWAQASPRRRVVAIDWGEWQWNAWSAGLQGFDAPLQDFFRKSREAFGIGFAEGEEALARILASRLRRCIVSTQDFTALLAASRDFNLDELLGAARHVESVHPRPVLGTSFVAPRNDAEQRIAEVWAEMLRLEEVGAHDNFFELGGNSLMGIQVIARLREVCGVEIPSWALYEAPSVSAMAELVGRQDENGAGEERRARGELRRQQQRRRKEQRLEI